MKCHSRIFLFLIILICLAFTGNLHINLYKSEKKMHKILCKYTGYHLQQYTNYIQHKIKFVSTNLRQLKSPINSIHSDRKNDVEFNPKISVLFERTSTSNPGPKLFKLGTGHRKMKIDAFHFHSHLERKANRVYAADTERVRQQCQSVTKSCGECISKHSDCAWCSDPVGCYLFYSFLLLTILRDHQSVLG